jgi:hypothetical protein
LKGGGKTLIIKELFLAQPLLYLDPGSGSIIIQAVLAVLLGIGLTLRLFWSRIKSRFGSEESETTETAEESDDEF